MSQEAKPLLLEIRQNLSTVFGNSVLINELKTNKDFQKTIERQIAMHKRLEKICKEEFLLTEKYSENFKNLTGQNPNLDKFQTLSDIDEITDEVNYLNVVSKNLFNKKMSEFVIDVNNNVILDENKKISNDNASETIAGAIPFATAANNTGNNNQNKTSNHDEPLRGEHLRAENFNQNKQHKNSGFNPNLFMRNAQGYDLQSEAAFLANKRLQVEILIGKVYCWKEKQRGVLILQYLAVAFSLLFLLATATSLITLIYGIVNDFSIQAISLAPGTTTGTLSYVPLKNNTFGFIFPSLIMIFVAIYLVTKYLNDSQGKLGFFKRKRALESAQSFLGDPKLLEKNENIMYHFQYSTIIVVFFFYLIFTLIPISRSFSPISFLTTPNIFSAAPTNSSIAIEGPIKDAVYYSFLIYFVSFAPLVIIFGVSFIINPKTDNERLNSILEKYIEEAKEESGGSPSSFPGGFGGGRSGPFGF